MATFSASIAPFVLISALFSTMAFAQETTDEDDLRSVIEDLRSGAPDFNGMEPPLRIAVRESISNITEYLARLGPLLFIQFEETDNGIDIYFVRFSNGRTIWQFARSPRGRIGILYFNMF